MTVPKKDMTDPKEALEEIEKTFFNFTNEFSENLKKLHQQAIKVLNEAYQANQEKRLQNTLEVSQQQKRGEPSLSEKKQIDNATAGYINQNKKLSTGPKAEEPEVKEPSPRRMRK